MLFQEEAIPCLLSRICDPATSPGPGGAPSRSSTDPRSSKAQWCFGGKRGCLLLHLFLHLSLRNFRAGRPIFPKLPHGNQSHEHSKGTKPDSSTWFGPSQVSAHLAACQSTPSQGGLGGWPQDLVLVPPWDVNLGHISSAVGQRLVPGFLPLSALFF